MRVPASPRRVSAVSLPRVRPVSCHTTPVLALGTPAATAALGGVEYLGAIATTAIGATVGAYVAEWLYP